MKENKLNCQESPQRINLNSPIKNIIVRIIIELPNAINKSYYSENKNKKSSEENITPEHNFFSIRTM